MKAISKYAFADPPYLGTAKKIYGDLHPEAAEYDRPETHRALIERLVAEFPDGWVLCLNSGNLRTILPMCPEDVRVGAWVKPFAVFKKGVNPGYCWEPAIFRGGRRRAQKQEWEPTVRDYLSHSASLKGRGLKGAKPEAFCEWVLALLGFQPGDEMVDLFPGTGVMGRVAAQWQAQQKLV